MDVVRETEACCNAPSAMWQMRRVSQM